MAHFGWKLTRIARWADLLQHIEPATVIDVGAAHGTPELYEAFPRAHHVCIDPLAEYQPDLRRITEDYDAEILSSAVGATEAVADMWVDPVKPTRSSFHARTGLTSEGRELQKRVVAIRTLDGVAAERRWDPPFVVKVDTEGHELEVIRGAPLVLRRTVGLIAEVSVAPRFAGGYRLDEFVVAMASHGFRVTNVLTADRRQDGLMPHMDLLFQPIHCQGGTTAVEA